MLDVVKKLLNTKSLLPMHSNVLPLRFKQIFLPIILIFTEGDEIESRLPFKIFFTLIEIAHHRTYIQWFWLKEFLTLSSSSFFAQDYSIFLCLGWMHHIYCKDLQNMQFCHFAKNWQKSVFLQSCGWSPHGFTNCQFLPIKTSLLK